MRSQRQVSRWDLFSGQIIFVGAGLISLIMSYRFAYALSMIVCPAVNMTCPKSCICTDIGQVICKGGGLSRVPSEDIPRFTYYLSLANNDIMILGTRVFSNYTKLRRLILDDNFIFVIQPETFYGLSDMEELSLQNNPLQTLASFSFAGLSNISNIYLAQNKITEIFPDAFFDSYNLSTLNLRGNPVAYIHKHAFRGLTRVGSFYLPTGIERIEPDAFFGMSDINVFQLDSMNSSILQRWTFRGLSSVKTLGIRYSNIGVFDDGVFFNTTDVKSILIEDCTIDTVLAGAFTGMRNVSELQVVGNRITNFHPGALNESTLAEVQDVKVQNNAVPCDCRVRWIRFLSEILPTITTDTLCSSPEDRKDDRVSSVFLGDVPDNCDPYALYTTAISSTARNNIFYCYISLFFTLKLFIVR